MCIERPALIQGLKTVVGFKLMERVKRIGKPSGFLPAFDHARMRDSRTFQVGEQYECVGAETNTHPLNKKSGFHAYSRLRDAKKLWEDRHVWAIQNKNSKNYVIVVVELSDNLVYEDCYAYNEEKAIRGDKMKIIGVIEKMKP